jgi:hypothetical protein
MASRNAAHYLRLPTATLRSWLRGRYYPTETGRRHFKPVIDLPDPDLASLSFVNLVEAHVLDAIRREYRIPLPNVRSALDYVRKQFGSKHPLAEQKFETDGVNLFISRFQDLISASESGQLAIRELIPGAPPPNRARRGGLRDSALPVHPPQRPGAAKNHRD